LQRTAPLIDISPALAPDTAVWPGDVALRRDVQLRLENGDSVALSSVTTTVHVGAHADAPCHYRAGAAAIDEVELTAYVGPCEVVTVLGKALIEPADFADALRRGAQRLLFRTLSQPDPTRFNEDFTAFSAAAMRAMGEAGVLLVGIDTPSVDPAASKTLPAHHEMLRWNIRNLEGLVLEHVGDGAYELIALPLKLKGFDASPVRAVLRPLA
jgi:arylformamidase